MAVPYLFSKTPGGASIPLAELDANFAYILNDATFTNLSVSGNLSVGGSSNFTGPAVFNDLTINGLLTIDGTSYNITGITGTGQLVLNNTPTLISPILGTPISGDLINCTGYQVTQVTGFASGILSFLTNPTSSNLDSAVVDDTGSGNLVFSNSAVLTAPNLTSPILGVPQSGNLVNCTDYLATNLSGIVPVSKGGTGLAATGGIGQILGVVGPNTLGYVSAPSPTGVSGGAASQILYQSAPNITNFIPNGTSGQVLLSNGASVPSWGSFNISSNITGILPIAHGGTGNSTMGAGVQTALTNPVNTAGGFITYPDPGNIPSGAIMFFAMAAAPSGWLVCNGSAVSRATYSALFSAIGVLYGPGDGSTTFNLPDLNGQFVRGWDSSGAVDPGRTFGSNQSGAFASHTHTAAVVDPGHSHTVYAGIAGGLFPTGNYMLASGVAAYNQTSPELTGITVSNSSVGGPENRPVNVALLSCIKY